MQMLNEPELEIEALKIAEDATLRNPPLNCSFHNAPLGFFLEILNILTTPSLSMIQYQLARALLENQVYFLHSFSVFCLKCLLC